MARLGMQRGYRAIGLIGAPRPIQPVVGGMQVTEQFFVDCQDLAVFPEPLRIIFTGWKQVVAQRDSECLERARHNACSPAVHPEDNEDMLPAHINTTIITPAQTGLARRDIALRSISPI